MTSEAAARYKTPRANPRVRRAAPKRRMKIAPILAAVFLAVGLAASLIATRPSASTEPRAGKETARAESPAVAAAPARATGSPVAAPAEKTARTAEPKPARPDEAQAKPPQAVPSVPEAQPATAAPSEAKASEPVPKAPPRRRNLFPSNGLGNASAYVPGPEGQQAKADEIVLATVKSLAITKGGGGKAGYDLELSKTKFLKGESDPAETLTLSVPQGDPQKDFRLDSASAAGKKIVMFLKNDPDGGFRYFALAIEDHKALTAQEKKADD